MWLICVVVVILWVDNDVVDGAGVDVDVGVYGDVSVDVEGDNVVCDGC